ncbi:unnamed protein product [Rotaria sordida]|uniref:Uncharacterized protein n=1 Tax=Rotaria sordida TaxID=392033 RepID=A0A814SZF6_9BILA|nr:unnamed protein product [Rotaria sordida]
MILNQIIDQNKLTNVCVIDNSLYQKLQSLVLADGEYYELVRSNFERADHQSDVHVMTMFFFFHIQLI